MLIFADIINSSIRNDTFPEELKLAEVTPLFKRQTFLKKEILDQQVHCHIFQKSVREAFSIKSVYTLSLIFLIRLLVFVKIATRNIFC